MSDVNSKEDWIQRNLPIMILVISCFIAGVCELSAIGHLWIHPDRIYYPPSKFLIPVYLLLPILFELVGQVQTRRLLYRGEISRTAVKAVNLTLGCRVLMAYGGMLQFELIAFGN